MILLLVVFSLALSGGLGAPTAVYNFVKCNPDGDQANCVTHQTAEMDWSPDLPAKLPSTEAQYLEAEPVEDERDPEEEEDIMEEDDIVEDESSSLSDEGESPLLYLPEYGSGDEGSAFLADWATPADSGSGEANKGGDEPKSAEKALKEEHFLPQ